VLSCPLGSYRKRRKRSDAPDTRARTERIAFWLGAPASRHAIALRSLNERIERADDVVAIQAHVGREVVAAPAVGGRHPHRSSST
jgi:hypothetical protein